MWRRRGGAGWGRRRSLVRVALPLAVCATVGVQRVAGQGTEGSAFATVGGAALGLYSGGMLGVAGSLLPCDRTLRGRLCVGASGIVGGAAGLIAGGVIGREDRDEVGQRARDAGYGALIGTAMGFVLQQAVRQYTWHDALLVGAFGAAVGAVPRGAVIGAGLGAAIGGAAWAVSPRGGVQDVIMFTVVGGALGGLVDWVDGAVDARRGAGPVLTPAFSVRIG